MASARRDSDSTVGLRVVTLGQVIILELLGKYKNIPMLHIVATALSILCMQSS